MGGPVARQQSLLPMPCAETWSASSGARCPIEEFRTCRDRTASTHRIDHGRGTIRVGSVVDDDCGDGLPDAPDDPGADATGRLGHERDASAEVQELRMQPSYNERR
jgi:hypothetical protein